MVSKILAGAAIICCLILGFILVIGSDELD